jgi:hypothetical protein
MRHMFRGTLKMDWQTVFTVAAAHLMLVVPPSHGQALNVCDLNGDGKVDILDVQMAVNMTVGRLSCTATHIETGVCNVLVVQRVTSAALSGTCMVGAHSVTLNWTASTSSNVTGYHVYRSTSATGPYTRLTPSPVAGTTYLDSTVQASLTYYYVATAVDSSGAESTYSNQAAAVIPYP